MDIHYSINTTAPRVPLHGGELELDLALKLAAQILCEVEHRMTPRDAHLIRDIQAAKWTLAKIELKLKR
jgi:hypothetical protein